MKLCIHCKHFRAYNLMDDMSLAKCAHPNVLSPVDGTARSYCTEERARGACGPSGRLWEGHAVHDNRIPDGDNRLPEPEKRQPSPRAGS